MFNLQEELNNLENINIVEDDYEDNKFAGMFQFDKNLADRPNDEDTNEGFDFAPLLVKKDKKKKEDKINETKMNLLKIIPMKTNKAKIKQILRMQIIETEKMEISVIF